MKSGLEDRNNLEPAIAALEFVLEVSMKSGLEDRNNLKELLADRRVCRLNEVRPGRPEQLLAHRATDCNEPVSMKSGLEDRNNARLRRPPWLGTLPAPASSPHRRVL